MLALLFVGILGAKSVAGEANICTPCHGTLEEVHGNFNHSAAPGSGSVVLFADDMHDDAGWTGNRPYFAVLVDCTICHNTDLPLVHGKECATCHPTPYDTLGKNWNKGCQQNGCHSRYHEDSFQAHAPFEDSFDAQNDCNRCHDPNFAVTQSQCSNCHAKFSSGDLSPPVTSANVLGTYIGPAKIGFSIMDDGKVGLGRTFYQLDGDTSVKSAGKYALIKDPGPHELIFWSIDQNGNTELGKNTVRFNIVEDATPPTTTSDASTSYSQGAVINLTATDNSTMGVKSTFYRINNGAFIAGTRVVIPATSGKFDYTLAFYSDDWAGNIEEEKTVYFTVTSGTGTLRLIWDPSDVNGSPCTNDPDARASWTILKDSWFGYVVASGSAGCPNWSGINDVVVPVGPSLYYVRIEWWDSYYKHLEQTDFAGIPMSTPGGIVQLKY